MIKKGRLYGIGVGPGDSEMLTLKAYKILNESDIIFCPEKNKGQGSFAYDIIKSKIKENIEIKYLTFPMKYNQNELNKSWEENANEVYEEIKNGKIVSIITIGDPAVYSTYMYLISFLKDKGVDINTISGIPSFCYMADSLNLPIAEWNEAFAVVPLRKDNIKLLEDTLDIIDNVIIMKPTNNLEGLIKVIKERKLQDNFILMMKCGTNEEKVIKNVDNIKNIPYLSSIIIKKNRKI